MVFNINTNQPPGSTTEPHHGVVLTHTGGKLIGIVFTSVPLPDLNSGGANMPAGGQAMPAGTAAPAAGSNINPAMLASLQNTANLSLMNAASNPNVQHLQNTLRQQQLMNAAGMGNPASGGQQHQQQQQQHQQQQGQGQNQSQQQNMNGKYQVK